MPQNMHAVFTALELKTDLDFDSGRPVSLFASSLNNGVQLAAKVAAEHLQLRLRNQSGKAMPTGIKENREEGKMFGVLVVRKAGRVGYLSAFSGKLNGEWCCSGFVPPPFSIDDVTRLLQDGDRELQGLDKQIELLSQSDEYQTLRSRKCSLALNYEHRRQRLKETHQLRKQRRAIQRRGEISPFELEQLSRQSQSDKRQRKDLRRQHRMQMVCIEQQLHAINEKVKALHLQKLEFCRELQLHYFSLFRIYSADGQVFNLAGDILGGDKSPSDSDKSLLPSGTGECAAPKLLSFAYQHGYQPLAGAEFWWGPSPPGQIRHRGTFYPPCRSKCGALLPLMMCESTGAVDVSEAAGLRTAETMPVYTPSMITVDVLYEDEALAIVNKPAGLLSVPGKTNRISLAEWAADTWPDATGPLLVHRLDMDTSGLVLIALQAPVHKHLQRQFMQRSVSKSYIAMVEGWVSCKHGQTNGTISLPLRVDLEDRPRQMVCEQHGRPAESHWQLVSETKLSGQRVSRLSLQPVTGRTHQLRVHMASRHGLAMPIIGDPLYASITRSAIAGSDSNMPKQKQTPQSRMLLHAESLEFTHPLTGKPVRFESPAPF